MSSNLQSKISRCTALHVAVTLDYSADQIIRDLLHARADPTLKDANGATPAESARRLAQIETSRRKREMLNKCVDILVRYEDKT